MGYLKAATTTRLPLPSDPAYWVDMLDKGIYGARTRATGAMTKVSQPNKGEKPEMTMDTGLFNTHRMAAMITGWNLTDHLDNPLPITPASIELLDDKDGQFLAEEVSKRFGDERSEEEERNFERPSIVPSPLSQETQ